MKFTPRELEEIPKKLKFLLFSNKNKDFLLKMSGFDFKRLGNTFLDYPNIPAPVYRLFNFH